jgi:hypothetical protein
MNIDELRDALHKQPFEPFAIRLADGRSFPVPHPDYVIAIPRRVIVAAQQASWSVLEPPLIASLDFEPSKPSKGGNGSPKRRRPSE